MDPDTWRTLWLRIGDWLHSVEWMMLRMTCHTFREIFSHRLLCQRLQSDFIPGLIAASESAGCRPQIAAGRKCRKPHLRSRHFLPLWTDHPDPFPAEYGIPGRPGLRASLSWFRKEVSGLRRHYFDANGPCRRKFHPGGRRNITYLSKVQGFLYRVMGGSACLYQFLGGDKKMRQIEPSWDCRPLPHLIDGISPGRSFP